MDDWVMNHHFASPEIPGRAKIFDHSLRSLGPRVEKDAHRFSRFTDWKRMVLPQE
jgi:hypothetical protein